MTFSHHPYIPRNKNSEAVEYMVPEYFSERRSRVVTLIVTDANHDGIPDSVVHVTETTQAQRSGTTILCVARRDLREKETTL